MRCVSGSTSIVNSLLPGASRSRPLERPKNSQMLGTSKISGWVGRVVRTAAGGAVGVVVLAEVGAILGVADGIAGGGAVGVVDPPAGEVGIAAATALSPISRSLVSGSTAPLCASPFAIWNE